MMAKMTFLEEIRTMPIAMSTAEANKQHYEVPAEFYSVSCAAELLPWARIRGVDVGVWGVPMAVVRPSLSWARTRSTAQATGPVRTRLSRSPKLRAFGLYAPVPSCLIANGCVGMVCHVTAARLVPHAVCAGA